MYKGYIFVFIHVRKKEITSHSRKPTKQNKKRRMHKLVKTRKITRRETIIYSTQVLNYVGSETRSGERGIYKISGQRELTQLAETSFSVFFCYLFAGCVVSTCGSLWFLTSAPCQTQFYGCCTHAKPTFPVIILACTKHP